MVRPTNSPENHDNTSYLRFFEREQKRRRYAKLFWLVILATCASLLIHFKDDLKLKLTSTAPALASQLLHEGSVGNFTRPESATCDPVFPGDGALHRDAISNASDENLPLLEAVNGYGAPVVMLLGRPDFSDYDRTFILHPGVSASQHVPPGTYGLTILIGNTWCNFDKGFVDGKHIKVSRPVEVFAGQSNKIKLDGVGDQRQGIHVDLIHAFTAVPIQDRREALNGMGPLVLQRSPNGGFYVNGTVNNASTLFQIDTGASITSISRDLANRAGIFECTPQHFDTANGGVTGCVGIAHDLNFGSFNFRGFQVAVMPNMNGTLLGMNVLRHLSIENTGDVMRLSQSNVTSPAAIPQAIPVAVAPQSLPQQAESENLETHVPQDRTAACYQTYKSQKEGIDALMRQGYTSEQGERFRENLRQLDERYRRCRDGNG